MNPVPFNGQSYLKPKGPGSSDQSLFSLQSKFRKIPLLLIYYLTKFNIEFGTCGKEWKKLQKFEYLENKNSFLDEIKNTFHSF